MVWAGTLALIFVLQPSRAFQEFVPTIHERDHEIVHAKVIGSIVVNGRLVADREVQVVVDLVCKLVDRTGREHQIHSIAAWAFEPNRNLERLCPLDEAG